jgi:transcriptional regulator with XRE-family HTH domain
MKNKVKEIRESKLLTQSQVAQMMGVQTQTISNIERAKHIPRPITLRKLAIALGVSPDELFSEDEEKPAVPAA